MVKYLHYKIKMNQLGRGNIEWWKTCIHSHNGIVRLPTQWDFDGTHHVWTDASDVAWVLCTMMSGFVYLS